MKLNLEGKLALVSGSSGGIGLVVARTLMEEGCRVILSGRTQASVDKAMESLGSLVRLAVPVVSDLATVEGIEKVASAHPEVDILVNNLGIYEPVDFFACSDEQWRHLHEVNVMSGVRLARRYLRGMLERKHGRVIFVSSETGLNPDPHMIHYSATKATQLAIARGLAELTRDTRVTVNAVVPGPTRTEGLEAYIRSLFPGKTFAEAERAFMSDVRPSSLIGRLARPEEVAAVIAFLCSDLGGAINGDSIRVEGGTVRSIL